MSQLAAFSGFAKNTFKPITNTTTKIAVVYTRVSSKEQADNNMSLETQQKTISEFAARNEMYVEEQFGGTYESAKTDGRKEFKRMLDYIKKHKG